MHIRKIAALMLCLMLAPALPAAAQEFPRECRQAMTVRSPQRQIELFTACLRNQNLMGERRSEVYKQRAIAYMHFGQQARAVRDMDEAVRLNPDDADNYYVRGVAYRALGRNRQAIEDSTRAIGLDSNFAAAYANRAFAYQAMGDVPRARADAQYAHELDPRVKVPTF